ncbi:MAG: molecular chaperone TorD family protein [Nitriliruptoraceae bacterium]
MSRADLLRALGALVVEEPERSGVLGTALGLDQVPTGQESTELFAFQLYPYGSVYLGPEGKLGGIARDRTAGFLRVLDVTPPPEPDHLTVLLDAYAQLVELDDSGTGRARHARRALLHEHLLSWVPRFWSRAEELAPDSLRGWARLLSEVLSDEARVVGPPDTLPAHLAEAPDLDASVDQDMAALVDGVLAPVRSGLVIARADLVRACREVGVGLRIGERAYALKAMLEQQPHDVLAWLAREARRQREHVTVADEFGATPEFWRDRLERTATRLDAMVHGTEPRTVGAS